MRGIKYKEPKSLLEIRAIKRKLSREIERYGWEAFHTLGGGGQGICPTVLKEPAR